MRSLKNSQCSPYERGWLGRRRGLSPATRARLGTRTAFLLGIESRHVELMSNDCRVRELHRLTNLHLIWPFAANRVAVPLEGFLCLQEHGKILTFYTE